MNNDLITHKTQLWLTNDESFYTWIKERIETYIDGNTYEKGEEEDVTEEILSSLAEDIEDLIDNMYEEESDKINPMFREFIADAISEIEFDTIAAYYEVEVFEAVKRHTCNNITPEPYLN